VWPCQIDGKEKRKLCVASIYLSSRHYFAPLAGAFFSGKAFVVALIWKQKGKGIDIPSFEALQETDIIERKNGTKSWSLCTWEDLGGWINWKS